MIFKASDISWTKEEAPYNYYADKQYKFYSPKNMKYEQADETKEALKALKPDQDPTASSWDDDLFHRSNESLKKKSRLGKGSLSLQIFLAMMLFYNPLPVFSKASQVVLQISISFYVPR